MGWRDLALIIALAGVLAAIAALGVGVLATWDAAAPPPPPTGIDATRLQARPAPSAQPSGTE